MQQVSGWAPRAAPPTRGRDHLRLEKALAGPALKIGVGLKVLIINWKHPLAPDAGGAEQYVARLAELWSSEGHAVTMLAPASGAPEPPDHRSFDIVGNGTRRHVFRSALRFLARHGHEYDRVLEAVSTRPFFAHRVVGDRAFALYMQMAIDVWNVEFPFPVSLVGRHLVEPHWVRGMRDARVIAISRSTQNDLLRYGVKAVGVVPPGCDAVRRVAAPRHRLSSAPRLLYMGRLVRQKRAPDAVEAFHLLRQSVPDATLDVIGDGYLRHRLEGRHVVNAAIHGFVAEEEKQRLLDEADLVLIPATREGWGITAIEAAAHGVPVVAYDVGGLRDSVVDGETGVLCRPDPQSMAEAAARLLGDPQRLQSMHASAMKWAARFTWKRAAHEVMRLLAS
jgi:glycosyltransferase involved in cell wall biosynthesis